MPDTVKMWLLKAVIAVLSWRPREALLRRFRRRYIQLTQGEERSRYQRNVYQSRYARRLDNRR